MKKMMTLAACALVAAAAFAQEQENDDIKENASKPAVEEVLSQPDGVSLVRNESDGSLQVFARGTADYDFGDARDIRSTTKVAELKAKAALAKFFNEVVEVEESTTIGEGRMAKAVLTQTGVGEVVKKTVTRENMQTMRETLAVRSAAILSGVVTLKTVKIPTEGSNTSGEIQVTVGISTKTLAAAAEAHNMITDSMNKRRAIGDKPCSSPMKDEKKCNAGADGSGNHNKPEVRKNDTLF